MEDGERLEKILECVVRVDERTLAHTGQIESLHECQKKMLQRLAKVEERTCTDRAEITELRRNARKAGGATGAGVAGALLVVWEFVKWQLRDFWSRPPGSGL